MNYRIFVEKQPRFRVEAESLRRELNANLNLHLGSLRLLCRMADGDDRSDLFSLRKLDHLANLTLLENAHNDRAETMCVRRKAERLSGNTGVE